MPRFLICSLSLWCVGTFSPCRAAEAPRPNIVIVLADDLGYSDVGAYGGEIPTPNLDALAANGLRFRQFYNNAVCGPTRASLLTGLQCQRIGHSGTQWNHPTDIVKCVTIGEVLQTAGYRTMVVGKWQERSLPSSLGFDRFFGPMNAGKISYFHETDQNPFYLNDQRWQFPKQGFYMTDAFTDYAIRFVEEATAAPADGKAPSPFFLYLAYIAPHWPLHADSAKIAPHRERYRRLGWDDARTERFQRQKKLGLILADSKLSPKPVEISDWKTVPFPEWQAERMAVYAAQVTSIDRGVGRVMEAIRRAGVAENTLIVFLSDNGAAPDGGLLPTDSGFGFGPQLNNRTWRIDGGEIRPGSGPQVMPGPPDTFAAYGLAWATLSNTPLRNAKMTAYEGGIRTPLIAHWPAGIKRRGEFTDEIGHVTDLMATCVDLAGAAYPREFRGRVPLPLDGRSLAPVFRGEGRAVYPDLCWNAPKNQAIRSGPWKLVNAAPGKPWELYRLDLDGVESHDISSNHPERVRELSSRWQNWFDRVGLNSKQ